MNDMSTKSKTSDRELLIRIDERQQIIKAKVEGIEKCVARAVTIDNDEYKEMKARVDNLWDSKNKMIGWMIGAGAAGGSIVTILRTIATDVLAKVNP